MDTEAVARLAAAGRVPHGSADDPSVLDFSANVNPRVPEGAREVYADAFDAAGTYPDDGYPVFRAAAADAVGCDPAQIVPTAGGMEAIRLAVATAVDPGDSVLLPAPSFGEYAREVELQGGEPSFVAHDALLDADPSDHALAVACNPNNPTGDAYPTDDLRAFAARCRDAGTVLLVDEAFLGFTDRPSLAGAEGVVVARSLTKLYGLPGLRAGFAVATGDLRDRLAAARPTWTLGAPAAAVGTHCLRDEGFAAETRERVREERARLRAAIGERFDVCDPAGETVDANAPFLLVDCGSAERADDVLAAARDDGLALRDARTFRGLDSHVRVAVRLPDENDRLLEALDVRD